MAPSKRRIEEEEDRSLSDEEVSDTQNPNKSHPEGVNASSSDEEVEEEAVEVLKPSPSANATSDDDETDDDESDGDDVEGGVLAESGSDTASIDTVPSPTASAFKILPSKSILSPKSGNKEAEKKGNPNPNPGQSILKSGAKEAEKKGNPNSGQSILALRSGAKEAGKKGNPNPRLSEQKRSPLIWTEDAEVAVLKGLVEFRAKKGIDPSSNGDVFYLFIQKIIPFEFSRIQLMEKVRRLKKKYENNALKGDSVVFARPHESKLFELSKKFWDGVVDNGVKNGKRKAEGSVEREGGGVKSAKKLEKQEKSGGVEGLVEKSAKKLKNEEKSGGVGSLVEKSAKRLKNEEKSGGVGNLVEKSAKRLKNKENNGSVEGSVEKSSKKAKKEESLDVVNEDVNQTVVQNGVSDEGLVSSDVSGVWDMYPLLKMAIDKESFGYFSEEVNRISEADLSQTCHAKAKELEGKWKLYKAKEAELRMMWLDIVREQMKFVVEELAKP